jgi:DDE superfamily endonuclease
VNLSSEICTIIGPFAPLFSTRVWQHVQLLMIGAILAPGKRTITSVLRVMGKSDEAHFTNYHRVLNRAVWSSLQASRILLMLLVRLGAPSGPLIFGIDDTIERRRGAAIAAKGIYRDPVRSSHSHFVKASGLRWLSLMFMMRIPWAQRTWAMPFLTVLAPSERYYAERLQQQKKLTDWARQIILQVRRWLPNRELVVVADNSFAALELLDQVRAHVCMITRLRLDAALYTPAPPRKPRQNGRPRLKGARLPTLERLLTWQNTSWQSVVVKGWYGEPERLVEVTSDTGVWYHTGMPVVPIRWLLVRDPHGKFTPQAFLCTQLDTQPVQILEWFVMRWQTEVTFQEARTHLGVETQRQWADKAIVRTTPALFGLFSISTLLAASLMEADKLPARQAAWYAKEQATFSDTLAFVRRSLWSKATFSMWSTKAEGRKIPCSLCEHFLDMLCYAA